MNYFNLEWGGGRIFNGGAFITSIERPPLNIIFIYITFVDVFIIINHTRSD